MVVPGEYPGGILGSVPAAVRQDMDDDEGALSCLSELPTELQEVDGFDDVDADAEETDDVPNTKPPLLPSALLGLSSDFHCPVNNNSAAASTFKPDRRRQADKSRSEY